MTDDKATVRRARILTALRWCFLNFGFAKTAFEDIHKRANLSRTLLYRIFKNKEEPYQAVFVDWLVSRQDRHGYLWSLRRHEVRARSTQ
jgi:TetR/AcrR family transcriptional regulator, transcriptional repressor of aconitase